MTEQQQEWLDEHPQHEIWKPQPMVSTWAWTDHAWISGKGTEYRDEPKRLHYLGDGVFSVGDTLMVKPNLLHVARKVDIV